MISATHFVEVITVKNGTPNTVKCGACSIPGSGSWTLTGGLGNNWFNGRQSFKPGNYKLSFLGATTISKKTCGSFGDFSWYTGAVTEPIASSSGVDITKWSAIAYDSAKTGKWTLDSGNGGITQLNTGQLSFYASNFNLIDQTFTVSIKPGAAIDGRPATSDFVGVAWGMSVASGKPNSYYVLGWSSNGLVLMRVVNSSAESNLTMYDRLYAAKPWTDNTAQIAVVEQSGAVPYVVGQTYSIQVTYAINGTSTVTVLNSSGGQIWTTTYEDPKPLGTGKIAFFNLDQENVHYKTNLVGSTNEPMYTSPVGSICTSGVDGIYFTGTSDDIIILYHADDAVTLTYDQIPGDPMTFTLPDTCILIADTGGYLIGPVTAQKTFISGSDIHVLPVGTSANNGQGHVADFGVNGFNVITWGTHISADLLHQMGWVDADGTFRFLMTLVPCGRGFANVTAIDSYGTGTPAPVVIADWEIVEEIGGSTASTLTAPTVAGGAVSFNITQECQLGIDLIAIPSNITSPQFKLENLATVINNPMVVTFVQQNPGGRNLGYNFDITVDGDTYSTSSVSDTVYFKVNDVPWNLTTGLIPPLSEVTITLNIPKEVVSPIATVAVIVNGHTTSPIIKKVKAIPRVITRTPLAYNRDLLDPTIPDLTCQIAAYRKSLSSASYTPYLFSNGRMIPVTWDSDLSNGNVLVCVSNDVNTDSISQIANYLSSSTGILPRRYVQNSV